MYRLNDNEAIIFTQANFHILCGRSVVCWAWCNLCWSTFFPISYRSDTQCVEIIYEQEIPILDKKYIPIDQYFHKLLMNYLYYENWWIIFWNNGILLPKLFWPTVRKNSSSDWEKVLKFEAGGQEFGKILRSLEQFLQTVKGLNNFW